MLCYTIDIGILEGYLNNSLAIVSRGGHKYATF